jgi:hypothetical protein
MEETDTENGKTSVQGLLASFRHVGLPLLQALAEASHGEESAVAQGLQTEVFSDLIDSTVLLSNALASKLGSGEPDATVRWTLAGSASQVVAGHFKSSGKVLSSQEAAKLAELAAEIQERFKAQIPSEDETMPNSIGMFRARMMETMVPVIGAVAQYAFGRAEHALLAEVAEKLVKTSDQMTRALAPVGATPEQWRTLCWNILRASGQIYTECHYAEADRLLYMDPEERTAYFTQNGNIVPMTQVWQAFNQRMAMLATLATYLEVPSFAQMESDASR